MKVKSTVLDQSGRPFETALMTEDVAQPGVTSIRSVWHQSVATGLTPEKLARILAAANDGDLVAYLTLAEEMEERDQHYASVLGIRKRAISGVEPLVKAASDSAKDKKIADDVRENIAEHHGFSDMVEDLLDSLGKGFSNVQIIWGRDTKRWWVDRFKHADARYFTFDRDTGDEVRLLDEREPVNGIPLQPYKWISHRAKLKSGLAFRGGLARLSAFSHLCKSYTIKDWIAFIETYGLPLRIGRYGAEATTADVKVLFRAITNIGTDAAAVLPKGMDIDFVQVAAGPGNDIFEKFARWADEQTSKGVLGQTMTSDNGSSQAQAEVHNEVRHDISKSDARSVSGTINRDLVKPYVDLHYGPQIDYPEVEILIEEAEDLDLVLKHTFSAADRGVKIKQSEVREKLGYSTPDDDDDILVPAAKAKDQAQPKEAESEAKNRSEDAGGFDELKAVQDALGENWDATMGDLIAPVTDLLATAESYEDAQEALAQAFPKMDTREFVDGLVKSMVKARALGDRADG